MKNMIALTALLVSTAAQAHTMPDGTFRGEGIWKSPKEQGSYDVVTAVSGERFTSTYKLANGESRVAVLDLENGSNGFLRVLSDGKEVGSGYCLEKVALCHYGLKTDKLALEETLTIQNGKLYKFGSKTVDGETVMWQEALEK